MSQFLLAVEFQVQFCEGLIGSSGYHVVRLTLAGAVLLSVLVALTITPMMASRLLRHDSNSRFQRIVDTSFDRLTGRYQMLLSSSLG